MNYLIGMVICAIMVWFVKPPIYYVVVSGYILFAGLVIRKIIISIKKV